MGINVHLNVLLKFEAEIKINSDIAPAHKENNSFIRMKPDME